MTVSSRPVIPTIAARDAIVVLSTAPDTATGEGIARVLVEERLAACVNVVPGLVSVYHWKGAVARDSEVLCVIKTRRALLARMARRLGELHPYDVPEILSLRVQAGARPYLAWLRAETRPMVRKTTSARVSRSGKRGKEPKG
jgi:periplasmic divalent cation tolerance protein